MGVFHPDCGPHCETNPGGPDRHHHCPECHPDRSDVAVGTYFTPAYPAPADDRWVVAPAIGFAFLLACVVLLTLAATSVIDVDGTTFIRLCLVTTALAVATIAWVLRSPRR